MPGLLGRRGVNAGLTTEVPVKCTQCFRIVHLNGEEYIDEDGEKYVEAEPIMLAMSLHMRYGCIARRRSE